MLCGWRKRRRSNKMDVLFLRDYTKRINVLVEYKHK